jgi:hypothetical protein
MRIRLAENLCNTALTIDLVRSSEPLITSREEETGKGACNVAAVIVSAKVR